MYKRYLTSMGGPWFWMMAEECRRRPVMNDGQALVSTNNVSVIYRKRTAVDGGTLNE